MAYYLEMCKDGKKPTWFQLLKAGKALLVTHPDLKEPFPVMFYLFNGGEDGKLYCKNPAVGYFSEPLNGTIFNAKINAFVRSGYAVHVYETAIFAEYDYYTLLHNPRMFFGGVNNA